MTLTSIEVTEWYLDINPEHAEISDAVALRAQGVLYRGRAQCSIKFHEPDRMALQARNQLLYFEAVQRSPPYLDGFKRVLEHCKERSEPFGLFVHMAPGKDYGECYTFDLPASRSLIQFLIDRMSNRSVSTLIHVHMGPCYADALRYHSIDITQSWSMCQQARIDDDRVRFHGV